VKFASFRDPIGRVFFDRKSVIRVLSKEAHATLDEFRSLDITQSWEADGTIVSTDLVDPASVPPLLNGDAPLVSDGEVLSHPRVWFPSYAHEWPAEMLAAAGELTLDIAASLLTKGWGLKDATPFNILFNGTRPMFIDVLSFEKRESADPIWLPYQQFVNTFLLPLLVNKRRQVSLRSVFLSNRDGLDVAEAGGYFSGASKLNPKVFSMVTLPKMLSSKAEKTSGLYSERRKMSAEQAQFIMRQTFRRLEKQLAGVSPDPGRDSKWTGYTEHNVSTIPAYMLAKQRFVENAVNGLQPKHVLDVGCNTGYFSFFAARSGAKVVGIDHDPAVVGQVWRDAVSEKLDVLPLVVDLSRPSPRMGWRNSELPSFLDRAEGSFDLVMMLAILHHIIVQERIPLNEVLKLAADLTTDSLIIEFVPPTDPLFRRIARGRDHLHADLNREVFETAGREFFTIVRSEPLPETDRVLYLLKKK